MSATATPSVRGKPLRESDFEQLACAGISAETATQALLRRADSETGAEIAGRNGSGDYSGILIPYVWPGEHHVREYRLRRDYPEMERGKDGWLKPKDKYLSPPGRGNMLYFPPGTRAEWLQDTTMRFMLTEGEKKCLALWELAWYAAGDAADRPPWLPVAFSGVWNWRGTIGKVEGPHGGRLDEKGPIPDLDRVKWPARPVTILFDSNVYSNEDVRIARFSLAKELRGRAARVLFTDLPADAGVNGIDDLIGAWGKEQVLEFLRTSSYDPRQRTTSVTDNSPIPAELGPGFPPVARFSDDLIPEILRALVFDAAERMQVAPEIIASPLLVGISAAVGRRVIMHPYANDHTWEVVPNLWGAVVCKIGSLKTPSINLALKPVRLIEEKWRSEHAEEFKRYKRLLIEYELRDRAWRNKQVDLLKKNSAATIGDAPEEPPVPIRKRLKTNDATMEVLQKILSENPAGLLLERDELTGWLYLLDRQGREGERAFFLEGWDGTHGYDLDRVGRGSIPCANVCLSIVGGIQPDRLRSYMHTLLQDPLSPNNDGLIQRFQLLVWPDSATCGECIDRLPKQEVIDAVEALVTRLVALDPLQPARFGFDVAAQRTFYDWYRQNQARINSPETHEGFRSHLAKYRSLMPSLAVLFEAIESASNAEFRSFLYSNTNLPENYVSSRNADRAVRCCDYLQSHAARLYSCLIAPELQSARDLAEKLQEGKVGKNGTFRLRDVYLKGWRGLNDPDLAGRAVKVLIDADWVRRSPDSRGEEYLVNPHIQKKGTEGE
jgi:hypothetical protein